MDQSHLVGALLFGWSARSKVQGELNARCPKLIGWEPSLDLYYSGYHLDNFGTAHLNSIERERERDKEINEIKRVCSQHTLIFFVSKG